MAVDMAKKEIAKARQVVIVEGYTDVMAAHLAGVTTAVATCGTAFGDEHIRIIRRLLMDADAFRGEVIFTFDGDSAGQKAALRAFEDDQKVRGHKHLLQLNQMAWIHANFAKQKWVIQQCASQLPDVFRFLNLPLNQ
jgi:DNA primase